MSHTTPRRACASWWRDPRGRGRARPADRHPGRSAGPEAPRRQIRRRLRRCWRSGETFTLDADPAPGRRQRASPAASGNLRRVEPGHTLLLDDGKVRLHRRPRSSTGRMRRRASRSAASCPTARASACPTPMLPFSALTDKDRSDLDAALDTGVDWVALSFVQRPEDIAEAQEDHARPRRRDGQDREAAGGRSGSTRSSSSPTR